jgi:hypothetical protein
MGVFQCDLGRNTFEKVEVRGLIFGGGCYHFSLPQLGSASFWITKRASYEHLFNNVNNVSNNIDTRANNVAKIKQR